jgi:hypothetical protein
LLITCCLASSLQALSPQEGERPWERRRRETQDRAGGLPEKVLKLQSLEKVKAPSIDAAISVALAAARRVADPLIDRKYHTGRRLRVPQDHGTIQAAIDTASPRDVVVVAAGTYFELITMKAGVLLVSATAEGGDELVPVPRARTRLPRRTLRTILDGSKATPSRHGMIDFPPGANRHTIVDGFTIQNLPAQDHHKPGHAHGLNMRGASPVVMNCYIRKNGSTGIGNHVLYADQGAKMATRDFRHANIKHQAAAVIYRNIICESLGRGVGCNHFSSPQILGNEVFANSDAEHGETNGPGIGAKHGATPTIIGNIVHDNPGGGISSRVGMAQGKHPIDRPTSPMVKSNVVYGNGTRRPGISNSGGGSKEQPVTFVDNFVFDSGAVGIGLVDGAVGIITGNIVCRSALGGIAVNASIALRLTDNKVTKTGAPGFLIVNGSSVLRMEGNAADSTRGPRFVLQASTIGKRKSK